MKRIAFVSVTVVCALAAPGTASALNSPTLVSAGHVNRHPTAQWTLPPNVETWSVEVATRPETASDGSFFSEFVVVYDSVERTDTDWLDADRLKPGTYYLHVRGYDNSCFIPPYTAQCGVVSSNTLSFQIVNRAPTIRALKWTIRGHGRYYTYYVNIYARVRVCDEAAGSLTTYRTERKHLGGRTLARSSGSDYGRSIRAACSVYVWAWRLEDKFFGVGNYAFRVWVPDEDGAKSRVIQKSWYTAD